MHIYIHITLNDTIAPDAKPYFKERAYKDADREVFCSVVCSVLQCVAVCCSVLQCVAFSVLECVAVYCVLLPVVAVCCSVLQCVAVCCSVLQCVAVCCGVLHVVAKTYYLNSKSALTKR